MLALNRLIVLIILINKMGMSRDLHCIITFLQSSNGVVGAGIQKDITPISCSSKHPLLRDTEVSMHMYSSCMCM